MTLKHQPSAFAGQIGVARADVTPPVGIYNRLWGAAKHDTAAGVHRPLTATALALRSDERTLILISLDGSWFSTPGAAEMFLEPVRQACSLDRAGLILSLTHTHAACPLSPEDVQQPGGEMLLPYFEHVQRSLVDISVRALASAKPATLTWALGKCGLAANRDLPEPGSKRYVVGFNPDAPEADDTLLVGRVTSDSDSSVLATIANYACHPTTLAFDNRLLSPDYIGAMREVVEGATAGAPCLFLQGASGELAPREQYVGDVKVADAHGRVLGYAVLSTLHTMLAPGHRLAYAGVVESGASLAIWKPEPFEVSRKLSAAAIAVPLALKKLPSIEELKAQLDTCEDRVIAERLRRKLRVVTAVGSGPTSDSPAWVWWVGDAVVVAQGNEPYSVFQQDLRTALSGHAVVVMNLANGSMGYLSPPEKYELDIYPVWQSPFGPGGLEAMRDACVGAAKSMRARWARQSTGSR
jgi:hypothetical protein